MESAIGFQHEAGPLLKDHCSTQECPSLDLVASTVAIIMQIATNCIPLVSSFCMVAVKTAKNKQKPDWSSLEPVFGVSTGSWRNTAEPIVQSGHNL